MAPLDILGHIAYMFLFCGILAISQKKIWGWWLRLIGEAMWAGIGVQLGMTSIVMWGVIFCMLEFFAYWQWRQNEQTTE